MEAAGLEMKKPLSETERLLWLAYYCFWIASIVEAHKATGYWLH